MLRAQVNKYAAPEGRINRCDPAPTINPPVCSAPATVFGNCPINFTLLHYNDIHARVEAATSAGSPCTEANEVRGLTRWVYGRTNSVYGIVRYK